jgi:putative tryptophan/tyrosine transport system substrate-binding protein
VSAQSPAGFRAFGNKPGSCVAPAAYGASIERRTLEGDPQRAPAVITELLALGVEVIVLGGARWLHDAALGATRSTPLVTLFQDDPVAAGLIASLARPGGNLTGVA